MLKIGYLWIVVQDPKIGCIITASDYQNRLFKTALGDKVVSQGSFRTHKTIVLYLISLKYLRRAFLHCEHSSKFFSKNGSVLYVICSKTKILVH